MMNIKLSKMQELNKQQTVKYQCIVCKQFFLSSQAIAGHTKVHFKDGWVKGTRQRKVLVPFSDDQQKQQQSSITDSSIPQQQQIFSAGSTSDTDSANAHQLPPPPIRNRPRHHLSLRDMKTLARLRGRLTKDEEEVVLRLLDSAREQEKESSKSIEVEIIPNKYSKAAPAIETTNNM